MPLGSLISAGMQLLSGSRARKEAKRSRRAHKKEQARLIKDQRKANRDARRANQVAAARYKQGMKFARQEVARQEKWAQKNLDMQTTFAKEGLRWKVEDARAAGVHPLYALGASTHSPSPVSVGGVSGPGDPGYVGRGVAGSIGAPPVDQSMSDALANAGQDIGRAVSAMQTPQERITRALSVERLGLENDLLRAQIAATLSRATGTGPGMPGTSGPDIRLFGLDAAANPSWSDAEEFQRRYGEPAEWAVAGPIAIADFMHNYGGFAAVLNKWKQSLPQDKFRYRYFQ